MASSIYNLLRRVNHDVVVSNRYMYDDRYYVPRVTEILSAMLHSDTIVYWANNLGFKGIRYREALNAAAEIGTQAHYRIETFFKDGLESTDNIPFMGFMCWLNDVIKNNNTFELIGSEQQLICQWFGGTYDALVKINHKIYLMDFKTSNYITYKHFLQLAAYKYMLKEKGIEIDGVIILQLGKEDVGYNEYALHFELQNHIEYMDKLTETFMSIVYAYYNTREIEGLHENIFGKD